jgi:hypothetical protein
MEQGVVQIILGTDALSVKNAIEGSGYDIQCIIAAAERRLSSPRPLTGVTIH